jgi:hypothetical protein
MMGAAGFSETSVLTSGQRVFPRSVPVLVEDVDYVARGSVRLWYGYDVM